MKKRSNGEMAGKTGTKGTQQSTWDPYKLIYGAHRFLVPYRERSLRREKEFGKNIHSHNLSSLCTPVGKPSCQTNSNAAPTRRFQLNFTFNSWWITIIPVQVLDFALFVINAQLPTNAIHFFVLHAKLIYLAIRRQRHHTILSTRNYMIIWRKGKLHLE